MSIAVPTISTEPVRSVAILGGGLAFWLSALAIKTSLSQDIRLTLVETEKTPVADMLYGQLLPPQTFDFHKSLGLSEADLILRTHASFAYGTEFRDWGRTGRNWVQAFHQPFAVWRGIPLPKLVAHHSELSLQSLMISAKAVQSNAFAHPPADPSHPLSRAEYGYVIDPARLADFYKSAVQSHSVTCKASQIQRIDRQNGRIKAVHLDNGDTVTSDFYIDASTSGDLLHTTPSHKGREQVAKISRIEGDTQSRSACLIQGAEIGWQYRSDYADGHSIMTVSDRDGHALSDLHSIEDSDTLTFSVGQTVTPWAGNVLALGQAAGRLDAFTVAPMHGLQRDIERLLDLFPISTDMQIEAREYNRQASETFRLAETFNQAHIAMADFADHAFWQADDSTDTEELARKLTQYDSRGYLVAYDSEPFDDVAWAILHEGLGRVPERTDPLVMIADMAAFASDASAMRRAIDQVVPKMPSQSVYRSKFRSYLERTMT